MTPPSFLLATEQGRQRLLRLALNLTVNTPLAPKPHERQLLDQFVRGDLTIDEVLDNLDAQVCEGSPAMAELLD